MHWCCGCKGNSNDRRPTGAWTMVIQKQGDKATSNAPVSEHPGLHTSPMVGVQPAEEPIYRLEEITLRYGERLVLDIPLLEVRRGESLAIVGPSGAGKSSLLRLLNFLEPPTSGTLTFQGRTLGGRA